MADSKLTCPKCDAVLRFSRPIPPGKPVQCPECDAIFKAPAEKVPTSRSKSAVPAKSKPKVPADSTPKKSSDKVAAKKPPGKPAKPESKPAKAVSKPAKSDDEEEKTYGVVADDVKEEDKPKISYVPDTSVRDLRGPAQAIIMKPTNYLLIVGAVGFLGWVALIIILMIPVVFPISTDQGTDADPKEILEIGDGLGCVNGAPATISTGGQNPLASTDPIKLKEAINKALNAKDVGQEEAKKEAVLLLFGVNLASAADLPGVIFILYVFLLGLCALYSGVVAVGASKAQNMESRSWGITASIMAITPITTAGVGCVVILLLSFLMRMVVDDLDFVGNTMIMVLSGIQAAGAGVGIYGLVAFNKPEVIAGFEYVPGD